MRKKKVKKVDPLEYAPYADDEESISNIMYRFRVLEQKLKENEGKQTNKPINDIIREVYLNNVDPKSVADVNSWLDGDYWDEKPENDDEFNESLIGDEDEYYIENRKFRHKSHNVVNHTSVFSNAFPIEKFGADIERWPIGKLKPTFQLSAESLDQRYEGFPNKTKVRNLQSIQNALMNMITHSVDIISIEAIKKICPSDADAIIMDPPLGFKNFSTDYFFSFLKDLCMFQTRALLLIWVNPDDFESIIDCCNKADLTFCDSISVELFDSFLEPITIKSGIGLPHSTRMLLMYRFGTLGRGSLAQQREKDTGWGIAYSKGKSRGRFGMPMVPHDIVEALLPQRKNKRIFVELWPSRFSPRSGWIYIDENLC